jgi:hypothetical protein
LFRKRGRGESEKVEAVVPEADLAIDSGGSTPTRGRKRHGSGGGLRDWDD